MFIVGAYYVLVWLSIFSRMVLRSALSTCALVAFCWLVFSGTSFASSSCCSAGDLVAVLAVAGSRNLSANGSAFVVQIASDIADLGSSFVVGCCSGADAALLSAVPGSIPPSMVRCFSAFGSSGAGAVPSSAVDQVFKFSRSGGSVEWLAGGGLSVRPWVRLANRTKQVINSANAGLMVFFSSPRSRGSLLACRCAVTRGLPIVAFPIGFSGSELPVLGSGNWVYFDSYQGYLWVKNQQDIFI